MCVACVCVCVCADISLEGANLFRICRFLMREMSPEAASFVSPRKNNNNNKKKNLLSFIALQLDLFNFSVSVLPVVVHEWNTTIKSAL